MTAQTAPAPSLLDRLDAARREYDAAHELLDEQHRIENEEGANPGGWADVDDARMDAGEAADDVLRAVRPLLTALDALADVLGDYMTASMVGGHFTCGEAERITAVLLLAGHRAAAVTFMEGHGDGDDDPEDEHADVLAAARAAGGLGDESRAVAAAHVRALAATLGVAWGE